MEPGIPDPNSRASRLGIYNLDPSIHDLKFFEVHDLIAGIVSGKPVWPDFREGYEVEKIIDAVDRASKEGAWVVVSSDGSGLRRLQPNTRSRIQRNQTSRTENIVRCREEFLTGGVDLPS